MKKHGNQLQEAWDAKAAEGVSHEIVCDVESGLPVMKLREVPGKGMGFVAQREIAPGEVVLVDTVFAIADSGDDMAEEMLLLAKHMLRRAASSAAHRKCFDEKVRSLTYPPDKRHLFENLVRHRGYSQDLVDLVAIAECNSFTHTDDYEPVTDMRSGRRQKSRSGILLPMGSRFNHSCRPNVMLRMGADKTATVGRRVVSGVAYFTAIRRIAADDEVAVAYVDPCATVEKRSADIGSRLFFCLCERCNVERKHDPNSTITCSCGKKTWWFRVPEPLEQAFASQSESRGSCCGCNFEYDRSDILQRLGKVEAICNYMVSGKAASDDPRDLLKKLLVAQQATQNLFHPEHFLINFTLVNNISSCHMLCATRGILTTKADQETALGKFVACRLQVFKYFERICGIERESDGIPCATTFAEAYYRFVNVIETHASISGLTKMEIKQHRKKFAWICNLMFGRPDLPPTFAARIQTR